MHDAGLDLRLWTALMGSGKPRSLSTTAIRMSYSPRLFRSMKTFSENLALSVCSIHSPSNSLQLSPRTPKARLHGLVIHCAFVSDFYVPRIEIHDLIHRFEWPLLPLRYFVKDLVGDAEMRSGETLVA